MSQRSQLRKERHAAERKGVSHATQRTTRQSPYKMRLVIDQVRGKYVNEALGARSTAIIVPECGHNDRCVFTTDIVLPVIFPQ